MSVLDKILTVTLGVYLVVATVTIFLGVSVLVWSVNQ